MTVPRIGRLAALLAACAAAGPAFAQPAKLTPAQMRQRQLECARYSIADPGQNILHLRCIVYGPSLGPPVARPIPQDLVHPMSGSLVQPASGGLVQPAAGPLVRPLGGAPAGDGCRYGYVWREAFPSDHVCVQPSVRSEARLDNAHGSERVANPGSDGCRYGYVWREASPTDHVCVSPQVRAEAAADNAAAGERVAR